MKWTASGVGSVATSIDSLFGGGLSLEQSVEGYRFGIDSVLLGAGAPAAERVIDLGAGVGVVGLCWHFHNRGSDVELLEVQSPLADLARANVVRNGFNARVHVRAGDAREAQGQAELVLMNPPYFPAASGGRNPHKERDVARHEVHGTLQELCGAAAGFLARRGQVRLIYPAEAILRAVAALSAAGLKVVRLRPVHSFPDRPARLAIVDARNHGRRELEIAPMLTLYERQDVYTPEVAAMLAGERVLV